MALDEENIVYCLLASTILANLDRPLPREKSVEAERTTTRALELFILDRRSVKIEIR